MLGYRLQGRREDIAAEKDESSGEILCGTGGDEETGGGIRTVKTTANIIIF